MLVVTHDPRILPFADRVVHIEDGRIVGEERRGAELKKDEGNCATHDHESGRVEKHDHVEKLDSGPLASSLAVSAHRRLFALAALAPDPGAQEAARAARPEAADDKRWQAVAPGRVEPVLGSDQDRGAGRWA